MSTQQLLERDPLLANRLYQIEALQSIFQYDKCVVKMFCGTGKSRIMTNVILHENKDLSVVVFPSLSLIQEYSSDYLEMFDHQFLNISSEILDTIESTTDEVRIRFFLHRSEPKVILVTYQSLHVLLECLDGQKIPLIQYDEAHHTTGIECQKLVFETDCFEKQVFYTATPETKNGRVLYDREDESSIPLAFEYTYLQGLAATVLNEFDICVDMYTENTNNSVYEAIARAILSRGTSRGLLFHSGVNGERNTSVWNFVNEEEFKVVFAKVAREFPEKHYTKITFVGMDGNTPTSERKRMLRELDQTPMNEIYLISSCETIGEGVDTKRANLCAFVDPKTSTVKLIQNIGRVLRRNPEQPLSTILIPCWINMEHYSGAETREEKDALIREQMRATNGDYSPVLNVLGALKQDDEELYNMCLHYPNRKHKETSLREQGFEIGEEEYTHEEVDEMRQTSNLEVHTDEEIRTHESMQESEETTRLYYDEEADVYRPIEGDEDTVIEPPKSKVRMSIHQNDEIQMLWSVKEVDFTKQFCTVVIECQVSRNEENWYLKRDELSAYIDTNGKAPLNKTSLSMWISNQKENYKKQEQIMSNPEIRKSWEEMIEKYPCLRDSVAQWYLKRDELSAYIDANGVPPRKTSLGNWVTTQKTNYRKQEKSMANPEIRKSWEEMLEKYPCLTIDLVAQWYLKRDELSAYIDANGKTPQKTPLAMWINTQKQNYKKQEQIMSNPEIRKSWEEMLEKYPCLLDLVVQWYLKRDELSAYIDANGRVPQKTPLGQWLQHQKRNYKKQEYIMSDPEIRKSWEETIQKYPCLSGRSTKSMKLSIQNTVTETSEQKRQRVHSELSQLHQRYKTLTSDHLSEAFTENPSLWHTYHAISEENEKSFPEQEIPRNRVIQELEKIKSKRTKIVVDMGCGKAHIARYFQDTRFKFINLDHVSSNELVVSRDISNTELDDDSVEICILSLAMWGSNCTSYVREAYRILESNGILYLIEPTKRWTNVEPADKLSALLEESGFRILEKNIAKFSLFICSK